MMIMIALFVLNVLTQLLIPFYFHVSLHIFCMDLAEMLILSVCVWIKTPTLAQNFFLKTKLMIHFMKIMLFHLTAGGATTNFSRKANRAI